MATHAIRNQLQCSYMPFVGHVTTKDGLKADLTKFEAKMERSAYASAVHRLIGLAKYLRKFLQDLSLRRLTLKIGLLGRAIRSISRCEDLLAIPD